MDYRKATIKDIDKLIEIRIEMRNQREYSANIDSEQFYFNTIEYYKKHILDQSFISWIALDNEKIIATSGVCFYSVPPTYTNMTGLVAYVMNMYTKPEYRLKGIAGTLLDYLLEETKLRKCEKVTLNTSQMGRHLYEKYGFKDVNNYMELY